MKNSLQPMTNDLIKMAEEQWKLQLVSIDINPARSRGAIAQAKEILAGTHRDQYAYAYIGVTGTLDGIALLSHALPSSSSPWLKVLELTLAPALVDDNNPAPLDVLMEIAGSVVTEVFELSTDKHKSESVKIYGDSVMDVRIWKAVAQNLHGNVKVPFDTSSHGRWLVLTSKGE